MKIGVIVGSTRPGCMGASVGEWVMSAAAEREDATYVLLNLSDFDLDLLSEPTVPGAAKRHYENPKTTRWSGVVDECDAFVFVTPEYNHSVPAAMKNAVDLIYPEWRDKAVTYVGYGYDGAIRAVEHWRHITSSVFMHSTRGQVALNLNDDVTDGVLNPRASQDKSLRGALGQLEKLAGRLCPAPAAS